MTRSGSRAPDRGIDEAGLTKSSSCSPHTVSASRRLALNFCANSYPRSADHPEVIAQPGPLGGSHGECPVHLRAPRPLHRDLRTRPATHPGPTTPSSIRPVSTPTAASSRFSLASATVISDALNRLPSSTGSGCKGRLVSPRQRRHGTTCGSSWNGQCGSARRILVVTDGSVLDGRIVARPRAADLRSRRGVRRAGQFDDPRGRVHHATGAGTGALGVPRPVDILSGTSEGLGGGRPVFPRSGGPREIVDFRASAAAYLFSMRRSRPSVVAGHGRHCGWATGAGEASGAAPVPGTDRRRGRLRVGEGTRSSRS